MHTIPPLLEQQNHCEGVIEDMSLRGAERRSKLKDKDKIASPSARNDTSDSARNDTSDGRGQRGRVT